MIQSKRDAIPSLIKNRPRNLIEWIVMQFLFNKIRSKFVMNVLLQTFRAWSTFYAELNSHQRIDIVIASSQEEGLCVLKIVNSTVGLIRPASQRCIKRYRGYKDITAVTEPIQWGRL